jgi:hypothetical protein
MCKTHSLVEKEEHRQRHVALHAYLDELIADYIRHTGGLPSKNTIYDLIVWSCGQAKNPTEG